MILWIALIAFISIWSYALGLYSNVYLLVSNAKVKLIDFTGFIMCFLAFFIFLQPLKYFKVEKIETRVTYSKGFVYFENFSLIFTTLLAFALIPFTIIASSIDAVDVYTSSREDGMHLLPKGMSLAVTLFRLLYLFFLPFSFYQLRKRVSKKYIFFLLVLFLAMSQIALISASRGSLFVGLASFVFMYMVFSRLYQESVKRFIVFWASVFLGISIFIGVGITISRANLSGQLTPLENMILYFGESFNHYGIQVWDNYRLKPTNGLVYYPSAYEFFTGKELKSFETTQDKVDYWAFKAGVGLHNNFSPIYGKLYMEFGAFMPFFILSIFSLFLVFLLKRQVLSIYLLPLLTFLFSNIFFYSVFSNTLNEDLIKNTIYMIIMIIFLKTLINKKYHKLKSKHDKVFYNNSSV